MSVKNPNSCRITKLSNVGAIVSIISVHSIQSPTYKENWMEWTGYDFCAWCVQPLCSRSTTAGFLGYRVRIPVRSFLHYI